jgi:hypothetical protein
MIIEWFIYIEMCYAVLTSTCRQLYIHRVCSTLRRQDVGRSITMQDKINPQDILNVMQVGQSYSAITIAKELGRNKSSLGKYLKRLEQANCVKQIDGKWVKMSSHYSNITQIPQVPQSQSVTQHNTITQDTIDMIAEWCTGFSESSEGNNIGSEMWWNNDEIYDTCYEIKTTLYNKLRECYGARDDTETLSTGLKHVEDLAKLFRYIEALMCENM